MGRTKHEMTADSISRAKDFYNSLGTREEQNAVLEWFKDRYPALHAQLRVKEGRYATLETFGGPEQGEVAAEDTSSDSQ